ncbi:sulfatase-like hydrolase/transferase [Aestuariicella hydrocarbonica]|uniref:Sulfatase-like hydrolase/transferase n=2 Tax=Pseudomaricurvus hydrocarbonicus TaxID=1470433 RepID=A0A9E5JVL9_9GAMM|nr:sulfatase-like hydrolase/transferase [Aestuariicella hydrocarbonica]
MLLNGFFLLLFSCQTWSQQRPNVVVIVADDLGWADVGFRGSKIDTPNLDQLAAEGMVLDRFYTAPLCSPTRAALMTGRDPIRLGVAYSVILPWDNGGVHTDEHFMSEAFQQAGYQTAIVGKWHLGHSQQAFHPNARGFEEFYGHLHTEVGFYPPFANLGGKDFQRNGASINDKGYETFLLANEAEGYIKQRDKSKPFFLYLPFLAPHEPLDAPADLKQKYRDLPDQRPPARSTSDQLSAAAKAAGAQTRVPLYAAVVDAMDQAIGQVLQTLASEGIADNTLVLFFSDNGASRVFTQGGGNNAPLRGGKAETYEGGIRVVSMVRWPEQIKAGQRLDQVMTVMDVFPTLAAAAAIEPNNVMQFDGINMWPAIQKGESINRDGLIFFGSEIPNYGSFNFTAFDEQWKLVQWVEQDLTEIRIRNELFNIQRDPFEEHNLVDQYPEKVASMAQAIKEWRSLYPINGVRARVAAPPGWRAPLDWADYPRPAEQLQQEAASSIAPSKAILYRLDHRLGERGRLIYNCQPVPLSEGVCKFD